MGLLNEINNINATLNKREREQQEKNIKKQFYNKLERKAKSILFDEIQKEMEKSICCENVYTDKIKNIIIDNVLQKIIDLKYELQNETWENLNFLLDDIYYTTANKCTSIYKKKEKANLYNQLYEETKKEIRAKK